VLTDGFQDKFLWLKISERLKLGLYSEVWLIGPPWALTKTGLNNKVVFLARHNNIEISCLASNEGGLTSRQVLILSGLYSGTLLQ